MSESRNVDKGWRLLAVELQSKGLNIDEIVDRIFRDYGNKFKERDSAYRTINRFLHSGLNPNNTPKSFEDAVTDMKGSIRKKAEKIKAREAILKKAATEIIIDGIIDAINSRPYYEPQRFEISHNVNYSEETIVLMISDIQAGTYISKESTGGLNEYNWSVLEKQFEKLYYGLEEIVIRHKMVAPIKNLHVHFIGDIVEGWDIFKGQSNAIDHDIAHQLLDVIDLICDFLDRTRTLFEHIHVVGVPGNHGRIGKRGENLHYVNYDYIVYKLVEKTLKDYPEYSWQITESWWQVDTIYDYNFLIFHGDDIRGWQGIPYYGIDRAAKNYRELLELLGIRYDYMEIGHFHVPSELSGVTTEKFVNGCWPGGTIYSMKGMGAANTPIQKLFAVHPNQGVTYRYPIRLNVTKDNNHSSKETNTDNSE